MELNKEKFLKEFGDDYGYPNGPKSIDEIRATEFKRLEQTGIVYLDHAGATLYSELQMEAIFKDLTSNVYANPHSQSDSSMATSDIVGEARQQVLDYCNASAKDYTCIFTSGATSALKLVGEAFPWSCESCFMHTMENHNSVLGIREYALSRGATVFAVDIEEPTDHLTSVKLSLHPAQRRNEITSLDRKSRGNVCNLFAFPLECNFSGLRFSLDLVKHIKEDTHRLLEGSPFCKNRWVVLIDAAKGCATQPPDLSKFPADFVVISFYKLFGYPTGLGALIARKDAAKLLKKTYFSGGTVSAAFADVDFVKRRESFEELFEDGTSSFLSISSLHHGFKILNSLSVSAIFQHTSSLTKYVKHILLDLKHENGARVCTVYGNDASKVLYHESGPIVTFNLKRPDGSWFGHCEVEKMASLAGIQLRTGCFCNPGACAKYLGLSHMDLLSNLEAGHVCWDDNDIINGKPTGAVRVSFGYMSSYEDCKKFLDFIASSFMQTPDKSQIQLSTRSILFSNEGQQRRLPPLGRYLKAISIYPIKSCGGFSAESWPLSSTGLRHDREWLLRSLTGEILTQKKVPEMYYISTSIDLRQGLMSINSPRCREKLLININTDSLSGEREEIELQAQRYEVEHYDNEVNTWFSNAIGRPCTLLRCLSSSNYSCLETNRNIAMCRDVSTRVNFPNEAQFLLISEESLTDLNHKLSSTDEQKGKSGTPMEVNPQRFRPNLIVSGDEPYAEDRWRSLRIGSGYFTSMGGCNRCQMINLVHQGGKVQKSKEPLATLASYRRVKGKIFFGILLRYETDEKAGQHTTSWLRVGDEVHPDTE